MPRGAPTARELLTRVPATWESDVDDVRARLAALAGRPPSYASPVHPLFGRLSWSAWGALIYKHTDQHLRQFGA